jgi:hypothetical protein
LSHTGKALQQNENGNKNEKGSLGSPDDGQLRVPLPPVVVIYFHIPKAGGQSVLGSLPTCTSFAKPCDPAKFQLLMVRDAATYNAVVASLDARQEPPFSGKEFADVC